MIKGSVDYEGQTLIVKEGAKMSEILAHVKSVIESGADVNAWDTYSRGGNLLIEAARQNSVEAVKLLLEHGADVNKQGRGEAWKENNQSTDRKTALIFAAMNNSLPNVKMLLEAGANVNHQDGDNCTALMLAVKFKASIDVVKLLLDYGADTHITNDWELNALDYSAMVNHFEATELLIARGADVNKKDSLNTTALMRAACNDSAEVAEILLKHGADVNARDGWMKGWTPLFHAAYKNSSRTVRVLLKYGADPYITAGTVSGTTSAIKQAVSRLSVEALRVMIECGVDVSIRNIDDGYGRKYNVLYGAELDYKFMDAYNGQRVLQSGLSRDEYKRRVLTIIDMLKNAGCESFFDKLRKYLHLPF